MPKSKKEKVARAQARAKIAEYLNDGESYFEKFLYLVGEDNKNFRYCYTGETRDYFVHIPKFAR